MMLTAPLRVILLGFLLIASVNQGFSRKVYVDSSRTAGSQNGTSWANAYASLQTALTAAVANDSLWVAKGTYYPGASGATASTFTAKTNVRLFGGFTGYYGAQETLLSQRNWVTNRCILSGDLDKTGSFTSSDAIHVLYAVGVDTSATFNGFRITGGNANVTGGNNDRGGGLFFFAGGVRIENCDITGNRALTFGGGMYGNGHMVMRNTFVRNNISLSQGGGSYTAGSSNVHRYYNCVFSGNTAPSFGGAIFNGVVNQRFYNCTFAGNSGSSGSAMYNSQGSVVVRNCIIWGNTNPSTAFANTVPTVSRCIVEGGLAAGTNILNANPNYLDSDYRIKACSPAADAGDSLTFVTTDLDNAPRPFDVDLNGIAKWDLGAFEAQVPAVAPVANGISGQNPACSNQQNVIYSPTTNNYPANNYSWSLSGGGAIDGPSVGPTVQIDWGTTTGTYTITMLEYGSISGCSTSNTVNITLNQSPVSTVTPSGPGAICAGDSILLTGSGTGVSRQWYRNGVVIPGATGTTFYAKQAGFHNYMLTGSNGCSDTASVGYQLTINPLPVFTIGLSGSPNICQGQSITLTAPTPGNSWQWYRNGSPIGGATSSTYVTGVAGTYNVLYTNTNGCKDFATSTVVVVVNPLPVVTLAPTGSDTICPSTTLLLTASSPGGISYQWYRNGSSIGGATASTHNAGLTGIYNARITDGNGCSDSAGTGFRLVVGDFVPPVATCQPLTIYLNGSGSATILPVQVNNGSTDDCAISGLSLSKSVFSCSDLGSSSTILSVTDAGGNVTTCNSIITVIDSIKPMASCTSRTVYLDGTGNIGLSFSDIDNGSSDNCAIVSSSVSISSFNCSQVGPQAVLGTIQDASGNSRTCSVTVTVADSTRPIALCASPVLTLDVLGQATLTAVATDNGSTDNCGIATRTLSQTNFSCTDVPGTTVTLQLIDVNGNISSCQTYVRVQDLVSPVAICRDTTIYIDLTGQSVLSPANLDNGSTDNCNIVSRSISQGTFTCQDTGLNVVTLTLADADTNLATCQSQVRVYDTIPPVALCTDTTFYIDGSGMATVDPMVFGANSSDNCGYFDTAYVDVGTYTCSGIGPHSTLLVVGDVAGVRDSCTGIVTIADSTGPVMSCNNLNLVLVAGTGTILTSQIDNGTTDNCQLDTLFLDRYVFSCADVGIQSVRLTGVDIYGNDNSCMAQVTVTESTPPTAACQTRTICLNGSGQATLLPADIDNGSSDNCGIASLILSTSSFGCAQTGGNSVTLTVTDAAGNQATCTTTVTVLDTIGPSAVCNNANIYLDATGSYTLSANTVSTGSTDNCSISSRVVTPSTFSCQDTGTVVVLVSLTDPSGNTRQCQASVVLRDTTPPNPVCSPINAYLNALGVYQLTINTFAGSSTDNCGIIDSTLSQANFSCANLGSNLVTATFRDRSGNTSQCSANVMVLDTISPTVVCSTATLYLDAAGSAVLNPQWIDAGSSDICGISGRTAAPDTFNCAQIGSQTVLLTISDGSGNDASCATTIQVLDTLRPVAQCSTRTVYLDGSGIATVPGNLVAAQSTDQCPGMTFTSIPASFNCQQTDSQTVVIRVEDPSGNRDSCSVIVTIADSTAPVAVCQSFFLQVDSNGTANLTPQMVGASSFDNCGLASSTLDRTFFNCSDFGFTTVTLTVTDSAGFQDTCQAQVQVGDATGVSEVPVDLGPDTLLCNGASITFAVQGGLSSYLWSNGNTSNSITTASAGTYWVQVSNSQGCDGLDTVLVQASVTSDPNLISESGNAVICQNDTLVLSVDPGFSSYLWNNGATGTSISVTTGGNYSVQVTDAIGCTRVENISIQSVPFPAPSPQVTPPGPLSICEGNTVMLDAGSGYFSYLWNTGQSTQTLVVGQSDTLQAQVWNGFGCHSYSNSVIVVVNPAAVPVIQQNIDTLYTTSVAGAQYQWYLGGNLIPGATNDSLIPTQNGSYTVVVTYANGCSQESEPWTFAVGLAEWMENSPEVLVFPNPTNGILNVKVDASTRGKVEYSLWDAIGRQVLSGTWSDLQSTWRINLQDLPSGAYMLKLQSKSWMGSRVVMRQ